VGRRGPLQAAYTIAELREMLKLSSVDTIWRPADFEGIPEKIESLARPRKRITELMVKSLNEAKQSESNRKFLPIFFRSPTQINGDEKVQSVDFSINVLENDCAVATDKSETLQTQLVCRSIGYKSISVDASINFDDKRGRVINQDGRVLKKSAGEVVDVGLYVAGWLGTGPSGVILTTMNNAFKISQTIIDDVKSGVLKSDSNRTGLNPKNYQTVTWTDWLKIDKEETERGQKMNKPREKIVSIREMLSIV
jgi:adrenodoxin-NADP+ reductase